MAVEIARMQVVIGAKTKGFQDGLRKATKATAIFAAAVAVLGAKIAISGIKASSNFQENLNLLSVSFGEQTEEVLKWSETISKEVGRSSATMLEFAGSLQALLGPLVGSRKEATVMSTTLAELAVDMSSFFNIAESDALLKLRAGLIGEVEPLRQVGVEMSVDALNAFALAEGLGKVTTDMTTAEKVALRYQFIMAKTTIAQGDAKATANEFANQLRSLSEDAGDASRAIGSALVPAASEAIAIFKELREEMGLGDSALRRFTGGAAFALVKSLKFVVEAFNFVRSGIVDFEVKLLESNVSIMTSVSNLIGGLAEVTNSFKLAKVAGAARKSLAGYVQEVIKGRKHIDDIAASTHKSNVAFDRMTDALEGAQENVGDYSDAIDTGNKQTDGFGDSVAALGTNITENLVVAFKELNENIPMSVAGFLSIGVSMKNAAASATIFEDAEKAKVLALKESREATEAAAASMQAYANIAGAVSSSVIRAATDSANTQKDKIREVIRALAAAAAALAAKGIIQWGGGNPISVALAPAAGAAAFALVNAFATSFHTGGIVGPGDGLQVPGMATNERLVTALVGEEFTPPGQAGGGGITFNSFLPITEAEARRIIDRQLTRRWKSLAANGFA